MDDGDLNSLIEGLSQPPLLLSHHNYTLIASEPPFPTPSPSPSPARPVTPQPVTAQYSQIAASSNQLVQLFHNQARPQTVQTAIIKSKQPQQILPKPLTPGTPSAKPAVTRINQQTAPLLINQTQPQNPTLLLNQVLTSSGPMLVQPAGGGGTVHLMLRPPGPGPPAAKPMLVQRLMTAQGPVQVQLQTVQTPAGPQIIAVPFPSSSLLVHQPPLQQQPTQVQLQPVKPKKPAPTPQRRPKPIKARSDSGTSPPASPRVSSSPVASPPTQKNVTSSLRQIRPSTFARKQGGEQGGKQGGEQSAKDVPVVDNLTATINSVAENIKSPPHEDSTPTNLNLNKRPNLTIFQKNKPEEPITQRKPPAKKKAKKDEAKLDLWDLMKSAGIGVEEFEDSAVTDTGTNTAEITPEPELLAQTVQVPAVSGGLRLAVGDDGRPLLIDGSNLLIPDSSSGSLADAPVLNLTPQALATAQSQLTQLLQEHGTITPADQQLLQQIFTVNPTQGLTGLSNMGSVSTETESPAPAPAPPPPPPPQPTPPPSLPPGLPPLGPDSLVITNNNGVPTLVASPALLQYLQTHQGIIQFQHDPVTKTIQPSLIIPHPPAAAPAPTQESKPVTQSQPSLGNLLRNQNVPSNVKLSMARAIQDNPNLLQVARDTNSLITYKESFAGLTDAELAEIDRKIQTNKSLLDQCFQLDMEKGTQTMQQLDINQVTLGVTSQNQTADFQHKFLESIGMVSSAPTSVKASVSPATAVQTSPSAVQATPIVQTPPKRVRKKKPEKPPDSASAQPTPTPPVGNLTFNIKQLTPEQNERLNIALNARGVTANRVAMCEMTDREKAIIEEEIRRVTGGTLGNTTVKFFPPPASVTVATQPPPPAPEKPPVQVATRYYVEEDAELSLNQLLDTPVSMSGQIVLGGSQVLTLGSPPPAGQMVTLGSPPPPGNQVLTCATGQVPPGSVIVGSNGQVVAVVQHGGSRGVPTLQLSPQQQQMLKSVQLQMQALNNKQQRTAADTAALDRLCAEQTKILQAGKLVTSPPQQVQQQVPVVKQVNCGTNTMDSASTTPEPVLYGPLYVSPSTAPKHVTKCEKGTSPIQIQMGTQTTQGTKMSTGTMTSPNTGKPQAVVAPAIVHVTHTPHAPHLTHTSHPPQQTFTKVVRPPPSPTVRPVSRTALIEKQLSVDQSGAACPNVGTPFLSTSDAVKRLLRYHVMDEKGLSVQDLRAADDMFQATAVHLLDKFRLMKDKYKYLLLMESMREVSTAERIMVDRNFIIEERIELEELRQREADPPPILPPPPPSAPSPPASQSQATPLNPQLTLLELDSSLDSDTDSLCQFRIDLDDSNDLTRSPGNHDPADINAQVQSAIDSILNLRQSEDPDERRKRKRLREATADTARKRSRRRDGAEEGDAEDADPVLDEAIRSILSS